MKLDQDITDFVQFLNAQLQGRNRDSKRRRKRQYDDYAYPEDVYEERQDAVGLDALGIPGLFIFTLVIYTGVLVAKYVVGGGVAAGVGAAVLPGLLNPAGSVVLIGGNTAPSARQTTSTASATVATYPCNSTKLTTAPSVRSNAAAAVLKSSGLFNIPLLSSAGGSVYYCGGTSSTARSLRGKKNRKNKKSGRQATATTLNTCSVLAQSGNWTAGPNLVAARSEFTMSSVGTKIVAAGGKTSAGTALATVEAMNSTLVWTTTNITLSPARFGHCAVTLNDIEMVLVGGNSGTGAITNVQKVNTNSGVVTDLASLTVARYYLACALYSNNIIATGGTTDGSTALNTVQLLTVSTNQWSTLAAMNKPRFLHSLSIINNNPVAIGGQESTTVGFAVPVLEEYTAAANWTSGTSSIPASRYGHAAVVLPCSYYQ